MKYFLDSSACVKLYTDEQDAGTVRGLEGDLAISDLCLVELASAFAKKRRDGVITEDDRLACHNEFLNDYLGTDGERRFSTVALGDPILATAVEYTSLHGLKTLDAIQLACAEIVRILDGSWRTFVSFDKNLRQAASIQSYTLVPSRL